MRCTFDVNRRFVRIAALAFVCCVAAAALPAVAEDEPGTAKIPTVFRDSWKITVNGKPQADGTFTMVFTPLQGEAVKFTINVVKKMKPKQITQDLWKELTLAAGDNYKVKKKSDKVVTIKKANKKVPTMALEITDQKLSGMSLTISAN